MKALQEAAHRLAEQLHRARRRVVLAESCTGGRASAALSQVPGVSQWHCGSAVTYREHTKIDWLGVNPSDLDRWGAVSEPIARQMARGVLQRTMEADGAAAITGHLGPAAPAELDGVVYIAVAQRQGDGSILDRVARRVLETSAREDRQFEAAALLLAELRRQLG